MRIIKFRIWDKCNERMIEPRNILKICMSRLNQEPYLIVYLKKWMNPNREIREIDKHYTNEFELMQYTGLKDMRGAEIYERDIVEFARGRHQVGFLDGSFVLCDRNQWHIPFYTVHGGIEVIGNVYENPELMQNKSLRIR